MAESECKASLKIGVACDHVIPKVTAGLSMDMRIGWRRELQSLNDASVRSPESRYVFLSGSRKELGRGGAAFGLVDRFSRELIKPFVDVLALTFWIGLAGKGPVRPGVAANPQCRRRKHA